MRKGVLLSLFIFIVSIFSLWAQSNNYSDVVTVAPSFSFQRILYDVPQYNDKDGLGLGILVGYDHFQNDYRSMGVQLSAEYFEYPTSYNYADIKLSGTFKFRFLPNKKPDANTRLFCTFGMGADFVFREDHDFGTYFYLSGGLELVLFADDRSDVTFRADVAGTFQYGSSVLHASVGLGIRLGMGKSLDSGLPAEDLAEGGDR